MELPCQSACSRWKRGIGGSSSADIPFPVVSPLLYRCTTRKLMLTINGRVKCGGQGCCCRDSARHRRAMQWVGGLDQATILLGRHHAGCCVRRGTVVLVEEKMEELNESAFHAYHLEVPTYWWRGRYDMCTCELVIRTFLFIHYSTPPLGIRTAGAFSDGNGCIDLHRDSLLS